MAVWSSVKSSNLYDGFRLDAEFYKPEFIDSDQTIKKHKVKRLDSLTKKIDVGYVGSISSEYAEQGVNLLQTRNVKPFFLNTENCSKINLAFHENLKKSQVKTGDILLARSGSFGAASMHFGNDILNSADIIIIEPLQNEVNPLYLLAFINSWYGQYQLKRYVSGGVQGHVNLTILENLEVPILDKSIQEKVAREVSEAYRLLQTSYQAYNDAQELMMDSLGLNKIDLQAHLYFTKNFSSVLNSSRFDAEFFNPRMQNLLEALSCDKLNLSEISRQPKERFKPDADKYYSYIEISDITGNGRAESSTIKGADAPSRAKWVVKPGDLITSTVRPVRRLSAIISEEQEGFICSSGFEVLRPKNISAEVLLVYLRLPLICELLDLHTTASMYPTISPTDLLQIPISLPDEDSQIKIKKLVQKSFDTRVKSVMMTESAKTLVEKAISGKVY